MRKTGREGWSRPRQGAGPEVHDGPPPAVVGVDTTLSGRLGPPRPPGQGPGLSVSVVSDGETVAPLVSPGVTPPPEPPGPLPSHVRVIPATPGTEGFPWIRPRRPPTPPGNIFLGVHVLRPTRPTRPATRLHETLVAVLADVTPGGQTLGETGPPRLLECRLSTLRQCVSPI